MAKKSAHGKTVGLIRTLTLRTAYMEDGTVLVDQGHGWKSLGFTEPGVTPEEAYRAALARREQEARNHPDEAVYEAAFVQVVPLKVAALVHQLIRAHYAQLDVLVRTLCNFVGPAWAEKREEVLELARLYARTLP